MRRLLMLVLMLVPFASCGSTDAVTTIAREDSDSPSPAKDERQSAVPAPESESEETPALAREGEPKLDPGVACPPEKPYVCAAPNEQGFECRERACPPACDRVPCPNAFVCVDCGDGPACLPRAQPTCS